MMPPRCTICLAEEGCELVSFVQDRDDRAWQRAHEAAGSPPGHPPWLVWSCPEHVGPTRRLAALVPWALAAPFLAPRVGDVPVRTSVEGVWSLAVPTGFSPSSYRLEEHDGGSGAGVEGPPPHPSGWSVSVQWQPEASSAGQPAADSRPSLTLSLWSPRPRRPGGPLVWAEEWAAALDDGTRVAAGRTRIFDGTAQEVLAAFLPEAPGPVTARLVARGLERADFDAVLASVRA